MKKQFTTLMIVATIFGTTLQAQEITLPKIEAPQALQEGTQRVLSPSQIAELLPWAKDSKIFLNDLLENTQGLSTLDQIDRLTDGVANAVGESAPKNSELLMRYALNRALILNDILDKEMSADAVGSADVKLRVLKASINMALKYYETDMALLTKKSVAPFVTFGLDYFEFLNELNKSIFDASAQYSIQRTSLEWLQWDMYRDLNNTSYAPQIVKINNGLKTFPTKKLTDAQSISYIRQMKGLAAQLKVRETLKKLELERQLAQAKSEEEKKAIYVAQENERVRIENERDRAEQERQAAEDAKNGIVRPTLSLRNGDLVAYSGQLRTVEFITDAGQVAMKETSDYNRTVTTTNNVAKLFNSYGKYNRGAKVYYSGQLRAIEYVSATGIVILAGNASYNRTFTSSNSVAIEVANYGKYAAGDKVLYSGQLRVIEVCTESGILVLAENSSYNRTFTTHTSVSKVL